MHPAEKSNPELPHGGSGLCVYFLFKVHRIRPFRSAGITLRQEHKPDTLKFASQTKRLSVI